MPILLCVIIFVIWFKYKRDKVQRESRIASAKYWEREYSSNFVRKTDLSDLEYIHIPIETLPFMEENLDDTLFYLQDSIKKLSNNPIVNLSGMTNTDLKYKYGTANLPLLTEYDDNYTRLIRTVYQWGQHLNELNFKSEAEKVLEYGICLKTDISGNYILLAQIYKEKGEVSKIQPLIQQAKSIPSLLKSHIVAGLEEVIHS